MRMCSFPRDTTAPFFALRRFFLRFTTSVIFIVLKTAVLSSDSTTQLSRKGHVIEPQRFLLFPNSLVPKFSNGPDFPRTELSMSAAESKPHIVPKAIHMAFLFRTFFA